MVAGKNRHNLKLVREPITRRSRQKGERVATKVTYAHPYKARAYTYPDASSSDGAKQIRPQADQK